MLFSSWDQLRYFHLRFASHVDKQCCKIIFPDQNKSQKYCILCIVFLPIPEDVFMYISFFLPIPEDVFWGRNYRFYIIFYVSHHEYKYIHLCVDVLWYTFFFITGKINSQASQLDSLGWSPKDIWSYLIGWSFLIWHLFSCHGICLVAIFLWRLTKCHILKNEP